MAIQVGRGLTCALLTAGLLAGCGGSGGGSGNGVAGRSPDAIVRAANDAVARASSIHVAGSLSSNGVPLTLDLHLVSGKGGTGRLSQNGLAFRVISVGRDVYIQASHAFWAHYAGRQAAHALEGKWLRAPAGGQFASIAALTNMQQLLREVLLTHGPLKKLGTTRVNGKQVVAVRDTSQAVFVATTGPPYPVEIVNRGAGGGRILFDLVNQPVALKPPAHYRNLAGGHH